ncbi:MAG: FtsX-like permease family protein [Chloroflexota bacterium]
MFDQLKFYLKHSFNDLSVNKRLTFFALLSIAAGVAAIVSLQTLSLMISRTLEDNLQESNRGDVSAVVVSSFGEDDPDTELAYTQAVEDGILTEEEINIFGQTDTSYLVSETGIEAIQTWIDESDFAGEATFTYQTAVADDFSILVGTGNGTNITVESTGEQASQVSSFVVDPAIYPFYGEITMLDGSTLAEVLQSPTDIVIGENVLETIDVNIGDTVSVNGANELFTVRGIVAIEEAVQNPLQDIFAGLFGFYIIGQDSIALFDDMSIAYDDFFFQLDDPARAQEFEDALGEAFLFFSTTSTNDLRDSNEVLVEQLTQLTTLMGLISLLIGSIGIVNTMQVIVRRRMLEVAVLKTLGMQGGQITLLFLTEAFLLGIIGSLVGIVLGWLGTFAIRGAAEAIFATQLPFVLAPAPAINGFIVGVIVATVFGFLPTLAAAQVRPGIVIRPQEGVAPRAGWWQSLLVLIFIIVVIALIAQTILGSDFLLSLGVVAGAFVGAGVIYVILWEQSSDQPNQHP